MSSAASFYVYPVYCYIVAGGWFSGHQASESIHFLGEIMVLCIFCCYQQVVTPLHMLLSSKLFLFFAILSLELGSPVANTGESIHFLGKIMVFCIFCCYQQSVTPLQLTLSSKLFQFTAILSSRSDSQGVNAGESIHFTCKIMVLCILYSC